MTDPAHGIFVLQGAFEVQNRLLEARDGLVLWDVQEIEMEALSNEAILLILEFNDTNQLAAAPIL